MKMPPTLKTGDRIAIVSTARKVSQAEIESAIGKLESWGLQPVTGNTIGQAYFQFAGEDNVRRDDFQHVLDDESVKAILFARGGYGTVRIIDETDWRKFQKNPKWLCGFSDITIIHSHLMSLYNLPAVHSLMAMNFQDTTEESMESLRRVLFGEKLNYEIPGHELNRAGEMRGLLCGGNLSLLCNLLGSISDIDTRGKILFLEEIDEHLYHVDRMMMTLKRAGKLDELSGLIVGHFTDLKNKDESNPFGKSGYEIVAEHVREFEYPVCYGFPAGHQTDNRALIMGVEWDVRVGPDVTLNPGKR